MRPTFPVRFLLHLVLFVVIAASSSRAATFAIEHTESGGSADRLCVSNTVVELGLGPDRGGPFDSEFSLDSIDLGFGDPVYGDGNDPLVPDRVVAIRNTSSRAFTDVWYVADAGTTISNWDGMIGLTGGSVSLLAFRVDADGENRPLLYESLAKDGIWESGEVWEFVIQDFESSEGTDPAAFRSPGLDSAQDSGSTASLIATPLLANIQLVPMRIDSGFDGGTPTLYFMTAAGTTYSIQQSCNLQTWTDLDTLVGTGAEAVYEDVRGFSQSELYYRVVIAQNP